MAEVTDAERMEVKVKADEEAPSETHEIPAPNQPDAASSNKAGKPKGDEQDTSAKESSSKKRKHGGQQLGSTAARPARESMRERKSVERIEPENFLAVQDKVTLTRGRGTMLGDIPSVRDSIEAYSNNSNEIGMTHKLLFTFRGRMPKSDVKHMKEQIFSFSGYLSPLVEGEDQDERDDLDEKAETKMSVKAYKLKISELKTICDVLSVNRAKLNTKDDLVDRLLDFLGAPNVELTVAGSGSKSPRKTPTEKSKTQKKEEVGDEKDEPDDEQEETKVGEEGGMPSDKALKKWVRAYLTCFNLDKVTAKHALETASDKFGVDLTPIKSKLKALITDSL